MQVAGFAGVTEQWELPVVGAIGAPSAVLIRPDGYVAWVGDQTQAQLVDALTKWFGPPATVSRVKAAVVRQVSRNF